MAARPTRDGQRTRRACSTRAASERSHASRTECSPPRGKRPRCACPEGGPRSQLLHYCAHSQRPRPGIPSPHESAYTVPERPHQTTYPLAQPPTPSPPRQTRPRLTSAFSTALYIPDTRAVLHLHPSSTTTEPARLWPWTWALWLLWWWWVLEQAHQRIRWQRLLSQCGHEQAIVHGT
jgi:hypothetical protein